jgi:hypothetical protein
MSDLPLKPTRNRTRRPGVPCPACGGLTSRVVRVNSVDACGALRRVRKCTTCAHTYRTGEAIYTPPPSPASIIAEAHAAATAAFEAAEAALEERREFDALYPPPREALAEMWRAVVRVALEGRSRCSVDDADADADDDDHQDDETEAHP